MCKWNVGKLKFSIFTRPFHKIDDGYLLLHIMDFVSMEVDWFDHDVGRFIHISSNIVLSLWC